MDAGGLGSLKWYALDRELGRLERQQRRQWGFEENADAYHYVVRTSCPPSTSIWILMPAGAQWIPSVSEGRTTKWRSGPQEFDLASTDTSVIPERCRYTFTNPYWYVACTAVPGGLWDDRPSLYLFGPGVQGGYQGGITGEYATAVDAETALLEYLDDGMSYIGPPACQLILRNNGDIESPGQFMEIDAVNRGRSYLFRHDVRGKWSL